MQTNEKPSVLAAYDAADDKLRAAKERVFSIEREFEDAKKRLHEARLEVSATEVEWKQARHCLEDEMGHRGPTKDPPASNVISLDAESARRKKHRRLGRVTDDRCFGIPQRSMVPVLKACPRNRSAITIASLRDLTGLPSARLANRVQSAKRRGLLESLGRGQYALTEMGLAAVERGL